MLTSKLKELRSVHCSNIFTVYPSSIHVSVNSRWGQVQSWLEHQRLKSLMTKAVTVIYLIIANQKIKTGYLGYSFSIPISPSASAG